jgi:membrane protein DedA with SNARE-associated domain
VQSWVLDVVRELGVVGIAALMFAENLFPPLPSEVIMPLVGYLSTRGEVGFGPAILAGSLGSLAGATVWYWLGRRMGVEQLRARVARHGAWAGMTPRDLDRAVDWFHGHGRFSVLLGRLVPFVRTLISLPAGLSRMAPVRFIVLSAAGTFAWTAALAFGGRLLGQRFGEIDRILGPVSWLVVAGAVVAYVVRVVTIRRAGR